MSLVTLGSVYWEIALPTRVRRSADRFEDCVGVCACITGMLTAQDFDTYDGQNQFSRSHLLALGIELRYGFERHPVIQWKHRPLTVSMAESFQIGAGRPRRVDVEIPRRP